MLNLEYIKTSDLKKNGEIAWVLVVGRSSGDKSYSPPCSPETLLIIAAQKKSLSEILCICTQITGFFTNNLYQKREEEEMRRRNAKMYALVLMYSHSPVGAGLSKSIAVVNLWELYLCLNSMNY